MNFFYNSRIFGIPLASLVATTTLVVNQNLVVAQESPVIQTIDFTENILSIEFSVPVNEDLDIRSSNNLFRLIFPPNIQCQECDKFDLIEPSEVSDIRIARNPIAQNANENESYYWSIDIVPKEGYTVSSERISDEGEGTLKKFKLTFTAPATQPDSNQSAPATQPDDNQSAPATQPDDNQSAPPTQPDDNDTKIVGTWDVAENSNISLRSIRFKRDSTIELNYGDYNLPGKYTVNNSVSPAQITITIDESSLTTIYEISGETLKLGSNKLEESIPSDFTNAIVFQRSE